MSDLLNALTFELAAYDALTLVLMGSGFLLLLALCAALAHRKATQRQREVRKDRYARDLRSRGA